MVIKIWLKNKKQTINLSNFPLVRNCHFALKKNDFDYF